MQLWNTYCTYSVINCRYCWDFYWLPNCENQAVSIDALFLKKEINFAFDQTQADSLPSSSGPPLNILYHTQGHLFSLFHWPCIFRILQII